MIIQNTVWAADMNFFVDIDALKSQMGYFNIIARFKINKFIETKFGVIPSGMFLNMSFCNCFSLRDFVDFIKTNQWKRK